jgi:hypothetical protein
MRTRHLYVNQKRPQRTHMAMCEPIKTMNTSEQMAAVIAHPM